MIAVALWQAILNFLGAVLAFFYNLIPNYGVAIILLTLAMRVVLLPLGIKQIRSMQAMQTIQPRVKAIQQKHKGDRQRINEETMKLYKEYGVNPLGGCLPMVLQFPVLIALFAVLRVPGGLHHIPQDSRLYHDVRAQHTQFLGANLQCSAQQAGKTVQVKDKTGKPDPLTPRLECGKGGAVRIPYYLFALAMIGTTYYQQRQMQRASPPGASQQQQTLTKIMPLLFGIWGFIFPAGLVVYWTTTNLVQIGQQHFMLPKAAPEDTRSTSSPDGARKPGRTGRGTGTTSPRRPQGRDGGRGAPPQRGRAGPSSPGGPPGGQKGGGGPPASSESAEENPPRARPANGSERRGPGGRNAGNRKKRRKR